MRRLVAVALFLGTAVTSFILTVPGDLIASTRTAPGALCPPKLKTDGTNIGYQCAFQVGSDFPTSALSGAYFDFLAMIDGSVGANIYKWSYSGASYRDYKTFAITKHVKQDLYVEAVNAKGAASIWDSVYGDLTCSYPSSNCASPYGMILVNTQ
jgi:hypothetical protein